MTKQASRHLISFNDKIKAYIVYAKDHYGDIHMCTIIRWTRREPSSANKLSKFRKMMKIDKNRLLNLTYSYDRFEQREAEYNRILLDHQKSLFIITMATKLIDSEVTHCWKMVTVDYHLYKKNSAIS